MMSVKRSIDVKIAFLYGLIAVFLSLSVFSCSSSESVDDSCSSYTVNATLGSSYVRGFDASLPLT